MTTCTKYFVDGKISMMRGCLLAPRFRYSVHPAAVRCLSLFPIMWFMAVSLADLEWMRFICNILM